MREEAGDALNAVVYYKKASDLHAGEDHKSASNK
jgi:hypothetical protein